MKMHSTAVYNIAVTQPYNMLLVIFILLLLVGIALHALQPRRKLVFSLLLGILVQRMPASNSRSKDIALIRSRRGVIRIRKGGFTCDILHLRLAGKFQEFLVVRRVCTPLRKAITFAFRNVSAWISIMNEIGPITLNCITCSLLFRRNIAMRPDFGQPPPSLKQTKSKNK